MGRSKEILGLRPSEQQTIVAAIGFHIHEKENFLGLEQPGSHDFARYDFAEDAIELVGNNVPVCGVDV